MSRPPTGLADPAEREKVAGSLITRLRANKNEVGPDATVDVIATTEVSPKPREITYQMFGPGGARTYQVREYVSRLRFLADGKEVWQASANNIPHLITLRQGETVEQFLRRSEQPNYAYFQNVELPKLLTRTPNALGTSKITAAGVQ